MCILTAAGLELIRKLSEERRQRALQGIHNDERHVLFIGVGDAGVKTLQIA